MKTEEIIKELLAPGHHLTLPKDLSIIEIEEKEDSFNITYTVFNIAMPWRTNVSKKKIKDWKNNYSKGITSLMITPIDQTEKIK